MLSYIGEIFGLAGKKNPPVNTNAARGRWGEDVACRYLKANGWRILERNSRPSKRDLRREIDIVAYDAGKGMISFVEVKTHAEKSEYAPRLWRIDKRKKRVLLAAFRSWLTIHRWRGNYRFDVIEVYGKYGETPEIDHIEDVPIFPSSERFRHYG